MLNTKTSCAVQHVVSQLQLMTRCNHSCTYRFAHVSKGYRHACASQLPVHMIVKHDERIDSFSTQFTLSICVFCSLYSFKSSVFKPAHLFFRPLQINMFLDIFSVRSHLILCYLSRGYVKRLVTSHVCILF